jgi:RNA polymerase sigma factor (sigma-70 family)
MILKLFACSPKEAHISMVMPINSECHLQLPEKQRIVFNLKYFEEMTYEDMSKVLNTSEGDLKASYHHAVKKIEKMLGGD